MGSMLPTESPSRPLGIVVLTAWIVLNAVVYLAFAVYVVVPGLSGAADVGIVPADVLLLVPAAVVHLYSGYGLWQERWWGFVLAGIVFASSTVYALWMGSYVGAFLTAIILAYLAVQWSRTGSDAQAGTAT